MSETASAMHLQAAGASGAPEAKCEQCGGPCQARRGWQRFCSDKCRNNFHGARRRERLIAKAAPDLFEALLAARQAIRGKDLEQVWINYPEEPALTLGAKIDRALAKAGHKSESVKR
jgi:predicted nucleic acid-binding Zn ribbon protein